MKKIQTKLKNCLKAVFSRIEEIVLSKRISFVMKRFADLAHFLVKFSATLSTYLSIRFAPCSNFSSNCTQICKLLKSGMFFINKIFNKKVISHQRKSHRSLVIGNQLSMKSSAKKSSVIGHQSLAKKQNQKSIIFSKNR